MNSERALHANNFDFLRLALAVLVIFSHSYPLATGTEAHEPLHVLTRGQMTGGALAVDLFFVMSGFLIAASAERSRGVLPFLKKRVQRIYPAFVVCAVLTLVVVLPLASGTMEGSWLARGGDFLLQTLRLREFDYTHAFPQNPYPNVINGSVWSIQYEFWCYVGVAILLMAGLLRRRRLLAASFVSAVAVSVAFQVRGWIFGGKFLGRLLGSPQLWARLLPLYLAGIVFYLYRDRIRLNERGAVVALIALAAACRVPWGWTAVFPFAGTYLVFWLAFAPWLRLNEVGRFGDFSYGTYLYAFPMMQLLMMALGHPVAPIMLFACATPLALLAAVASWYAIERRFLRRGRRRETLAHAIDRESSRIPKAAAQAVAISAGTSEQ